MLDKNNLTIFQSTTIGVIGEFILHRIAKLDPSAIIGENGHIYLPSKGQNILENGQVAIGNRIINSFVKFADDFWENQYELYYKEYSEYQHLRNFDLTQLYEIIAELKFLKESLGIEKLNSILSNEHLSHCDNYNLLITKICALVHASGLIKLVELDSLALSNIKKILGVQPIPITEQILPEITELPTSAPLRVALESSYRLDKWKQNRHNYGVFEVASKTNYTNRVEVFIAGENDGDILALEAARQVIDLIGIDAAKIQLVFAAHLFKNNNPLNCKFTLKGTEICKQIGWDTKHRLTVAEKLARLASITFHLGRMLIQCTWVEGRPKGNKVDTSISISPLWVVEVDVRGQKDIFTEQVYAPHEVYITVSPGPWAEKWLNRVGLKAGIALHQFGWLATKILEIDPYHDELALKLAIHLTMISRIKVYDKNQYEHKVGSLLEAVEIESKINKARENSREAYNLKKRWDNALILLTSLRWQIVYDNITYPEWLKPNSKVDKPSGWRTEKIIDQLWKAKLAIMLPDPIPSMLEARKELRQIKPAETKSSSKLTTEQIRRGRQAKGWSQRKLAGYLGISQTMVALLEGGQRSINPQLEAQLRRILEI